jgi:isopenicillin-N N-acyltransferase-like protein
MKVSKLLNIVECAGTPYEIGLQYGKASKAILKKNLSMCLKTLTDFAKITLNTDLNTDEILSIADKFLPLVVDFDSELIEFVKGEAKGAGMSFPEVFYLRCALDILFYYGQISGMCTSFAATGSATRSGKTIVGRNIDFSGDWPFELMKVRHADGMEQLALSFGGVEWDVLNSNGFCNSMNSTFNLDYQVNIPYGCYIFKAMRQHSIGAALKVFCQAARGLLYHVLANGEGDIIGIESNSQEFQILQPEEDILVHSNHYLSDIFKKGDGVYTTFRDITDTFLRVTRIRNLMKRHHGDITCEVMMEILSDHNNFPNSICRHPDPASPGALVNKTLASVIMVPEDRKMFIAYGNPCQSEYMEYGL